MSGEDFDVLGPNGVFIEEIDSQVSGEVQESFTVQLPPGVGICKVCERSHEDMFIVVKKWHCMSRSIGSSHFMRCVCMCYSILCKGYAFPGGI
jgi:hypothetical protein